MITAAQLATKGKEMREAQSEYFRTKKFAQLDRCRRLEREFDNMVNQVLTAQTPRTGDLFNQNNQ